MRAGEASEEEADDDDDDDAESAEESFLVSYVRMVRPAVPTTKRFVPPTEVIVYTRSGTSIFATCFDDDDDDDDEEEEEPVAAAASHTLTVLSHPPLRTAPVSGAYRTHLTAFAWLPKINSLSATVSYLHYEKKRGKRVRGAQWRIR